MLLLIDLSVSWSRRQGADKRLLNIADEGCEGCLALDEAPLSPDAETFTAPSFNEKIRVDLLCAGNVVSLHAMDLRAKLPLRVQVCS